MKKTVRKDEQIQLIMECRQSGLNDHQWCEQNGIKPGTFYNWVSKLRKRGYTFPVSESKTAMLPNRQEVVRVDLIENEESIPSAIIEQNTSVPAYTSTGARLIAEISISHTQIKIYDAAQTSQISSLIAALGGEAGAW